MDCIRHCNSHRPPRPARHCRGTEGPDQHPRIFRHLCGSVLAAVYSVVVADVLRLRSVPRRILGRGVGSPERSGQGQRYPAGRQDRLWRPGRQSRGVHWPHRGSGAELFPPRSVHCLLLGSNCMAVLLRYGFPSPEQSALRHMGRLLRQHERLHASTGQQG